MNNNYKPLIDKLDAIQKEAIALIASSSIDTAIELSSMTNKIAEVLGVLEAWQDEQDNMLAEMGKDLEAVANG